MLKTFVFDLPVLFLVALGSGTILAATLVFPLFDRGEQRVGGQELNLVRPPRRLGCTNVAISARIMGCQTASKWGFGC
jgi:hypothetical protein